jgi:3'-5' exoribonuclease
VEKIKKRSFLCNLKEDDIVEDYFFVKSKFESRGKTGKPYISLVVCDSSGEMDARIWDNVEVLGMNFEEGNFVKLKGEVRLHQGKLQIAVSNIEKVGVPLPYIELKDFFPVSKKDPQEMAKEFFKLIEGITDNDLKTLLNSIFRTPFIWQKFSYYPAAKSIHHAYIHGLLEHTISVGNIVKFLSRSYPRIDRDIALAGALLHDIGKICELEITNPNVYTLKGKLLGHLIEGVIILEKKAGELKNFPPKKLLFLEHIILSHHGSKEAGSPVEPQTIEALLVHLADYVDASLNNVYEIIDEGKETGIQWSYSKFYSRSFYTEGEEKKEPPASTIPPEAVEELKKLKEKLENKE